MAIAGGVLSGYNTAFESSFFHSEFDNASAWTPPS